MLNWQRIENPLGAIVGVGWVLLLVALSWLSPNAPNGPKAPPDRQQAAYEHRGTEQAPLIVEIRKSKNAENESNPAGTYRVGQRTDSWLGAWSLSDRIAAIATVAGILQAVALIITIGVMRRTAKRQLRAYVFVSSCRVTNVSEGDGMPVAHVVIKNFGQTPAYGVENVSGVAADRFPPPATLDFTIANAEFQSSAHSRSDFGPTQWEESITEAGRTLTADERRAVADGSGAVWVYGEIRYRDAFGSQQWTRYRFITGGPVGVRPGGQMAAWVEGNEAS